jgi:hypothetical protein
MWIDAYVAQTWKCMSLCIAKQDVLSFNVLRYIRCLNLEMHESLYS